MRFLRREFLEVIQVLSMVFLLVLMSCLLSAIARSLGKYDSTGKRKALLAAIEFSIVSTAASMGAAERPKDG